MHCPRTEDLSAYTDRALPPAAQRQLEHHLATCSTCSCQLQALRALRDDLRALPAPKLDMDLARHLEPRLRPRQQRPRRVPWNWSGLLPTGLAATAALVSGVWLGGLLLGSGAVAVAPATPIVRVFDPVPPGGLCAVAEICRLSKGTP